MAEDRPGLFHFDRDGETSPRRLAVIVGVGLVALLLLLWLFRDSAPAPEAVLPASQQSPTAQPPSAPIQARPMPSNSVAQLRLHGVMGIGDSGSAILSTGAGPQRLVRVGRDVIPGVPLLAVAGDHILVRENGREVRLAFAEDQALPSTEMSASDSE